MSNDSIKATVEESQQNNFHDHVYLTQAQSDTLNVMGGEAVVIEADGESITLRVRPARETADTNTVALTEEQRRDLGVAVGDDITVRKAPQGAAPRDVTQASSIQDELTRLRKGTTGTVSSDNNASSTQDNSGGVDVDVQAGSNNTEESDTESANTEGNTGVTYDDIGGLDDELKAIREMIELPLQRPELFDEFGVEAPKGVLLHGPPGTGKTLTAKAIANETSARFLSIQGPEIMSKYKGESEAELRRFFEEAREGGPAIIFFDEIDAIAPQRNDDADAENRLVAQLLSLMDGMGSQENVVVIGATNRVDSIDPALRRGGRFDRELKIGIPDEQGRKEILEVLTESMPLADDVSLDQLASRTHGFVGADLDALTREAGLDALQRVEGNEDSERVVRMQDFTDALTDVEASAMREVVSESPQVTFEDVGGLDEAKRRLRENVEWPVQYDSLYDAANAKPPAGVLLHGPQGTGKTTLARAMAGETDVNFIQVRGPELINKYVGESEKAVRELFDKARQAAPAVLFFDELDAIASGGDHEVTDRVISQLIAELDTLSDNPNVTVLGATEVLSDIDDRLLGPGRFEEQIEIERPTEEERRKILALHLGDRPTEDIDTEAVLDAFNDKTTGAQIEALVRRATMRAIRRVADDINPDEASDHTDEVVIRQDDLDKALQDINLA